jgi:glutaconyl-CoA/methylmalonyl-CoA decarboxylase subunit gamma
MIKKLRVTVDGKTYDVTVELQTEGDAGEISVPATAAPPPSPAASPPVIAPAAPVAPAPAPAAAPKTTTTPGAVLSPLAGRVTAIVAQVGQQVKEGEHLLTLEAMKMNTFVFAPKSGSVVEITTNVGAAVEEGQCLARVE